MRPTEGECVEIDRDSRHEIQLKHLWFLKYMDKGKERTLKVFEDLVEYCDNLALKFDFKVVSHYCRQHPYDAEKCCLAVFEKWYVSDTPGYVRSWNGLLKAFHELGLERLVEDIQTALKCVIL